MQGLHPRLCFPQCQKWMLRKAGGNREMTTQHFSILFPFLPSVLSKPLVTSCWARSGFCVLCISVDFLSINLHGLPFNAYEMLRSILPCHEEFCSVTTWVCHNAPPASFTCWFLVLSEGGRDWPSFSDVHLKQTGFIRICISLWIIISPCKTLLIKLNFVFLWRGICIW